MRILIFHGYLLGGTGSNVYNARLAAALVELGHEVHLLCQDRHPEEHRFVDACGDWDSGELRVRALRPPISDRAAGCTVYRPDIGGLLPVYVADRYDGIQARPFAECADEEIARYIDANVAAVREVAALVCPDVALANHLVMGPVILARGLAGAVPDGAVPDGAVPDGAVPDDAVPDGAVPGGAVPAGAVPDDVVPDGAVPYAVKVHGSALEYTVKPDPERFLPFAREGLASARGVLVGSRHTAESLWRALRDATVQSRTRLGPPGVDVARFRPRERADAVAGVSALAERLAQSDAPHREEREDAFARDERAAGAALRRLDLERDRLVAFVGKLIAAKGVDLLLAAWPLVLARVPQARLVIVGFGAERERLEAAAAAAALSERVVFTGRLDHEELAVLLPACEALVVPSTFPEAFGMVAVEAAACGALPISAAHSGLAEVSAVLARAVPAEVAPLLSFPVDDAAVPALADRIVAWLRVDHDLREQTRARLVETVRERWSWQGVARGVIAAARGELEALPAP